MSSDAMAARSSSRSAGTPTFAGAVADAERLRERISALDVPIPRSIGRLTVSIGVAQYKPGETIMQTFARADEALYKAKQRGRNRVES